MLNMHKSTTQHRIVSYVPMDIVEYNIHDLAQFMFDNSRRIMGKPLFNIVVDRFKNSKTKQLDLSNHVQMDEKTSKNAKIMKETLSLSRYL